MSLFPLRSVRLFFLMAKSMASSMAKGISFSRRKRWIMSLTRKTMSAQELMCSAAWSTKLVTITKLKTKKKSFFHWPSLKKL